MNIFKLQHTIMIFIYFKLKHTIFKITSILVLKQLVTSGMDQSPSSLQNRTAVPLI